MATKAKQTKPRVDHTRKTRADRRKGYLDALAIRMGFSGWGDFQKSMRECAEEPTTDQGVNNRVRIMLSRIIEHLPGGDPAVPPADMDKVRDLYPQLERHPKKLE